MYLNANTHVVVGQTTIQYMSNLGETIVKARSAKGWSQEDLAKRSGVSQGTIGHLESGRNSSSRKLPDIARALGMSVEELLAWKPHTGSASIEREKPQKWPFKVSVDRVLSLPTSKLERIEGYMLAVIEEHEATVQKRSA